MYEVNAENKERSFTALIRGGQNAAGLGRLDGVVMAGWRSGALVQVVFQRYLASDARCWTRRTRGLQTVSWARSVFGPSHAN